MLGAIAPYIVSVSAMLLAAVCALTLFRTVRHLDPSKPRASRPVNSHEKVAV